MALQTSKKSGARIAGGIAGAATFLIFLIAYTSDSLWIAPPETDTLQVNTENKAIWDRPAGIVELPCDPTKVAGDPILARTACEEGTFVAFAKGFRSGEFVSVAKTWDAGPVHITKADRYGEVTAMLHGPMDFGSITFLGQQSQHFVAVDTNETQFAN